MPSIALVLFLTAAAFGLFMASRILTKKTLPLIPALIHGTAGAAGLVVLLYAVLLEGFGTEGYALVLFLAAAAIGFYLFSCHLRKVPHPKLLILVHALLAFSGAGVLIWSLLS